MCASSIERFGTYKIERWTVYTSVYAVQILMVYALMHKQAEKPITKALRFFSFVHWFFSFLFFLILFYSVHYFSISQSRSIHISSRSGTLSFRRHLHLIHLSFQKHFPYLYSHRFVMFGHLYIRLNRCTHHTRVYPI